jgi:hypothetical protein
MQRVTSLRHVFVEFIPKVLEDGVIYVSIPYATAAHRCCCGCGHEVITPLSPTDWTLVFDGQTVTLDPSVGNWSFSCQSHYWIRRNKVIWARRWSPREIQAGRRHDALAKESCFAGSEAPAGRETAGFDDLKEDDADGGVWQKVKNWLFGTNRHSTKGK